MSINLEQPLPRQSHHKSNKLLVSSSSLSPGISPRHNNQSQTTASTMNVCSSFVADELEVTFFLNICHNRE